MVEQNNWPQFLIISPSILQGISIPAQYYDHLLCYYQCQSIDTMDMLQQSFRLRSNSDCYLWMAGGRSAAVYFDRASQIRFYQKNQKHLQLQLFEGLDLKLQFDPQNPLNKMQLENMYQNAYMCFNFHARFKAMVTAMGAVVVEDEQIPIPKKKAQSVAKILKHAKEAWEEELEKADEFEAEILRNDTDQFNIAIHKLTRRQFAIGFDTTQKKYFFYRFNETAANLALRKKNKFNPNSFCSHSYDDCRKCVRHFKNAEPLNDVWFYQPNEVESLFTIIACKKQKPILYMLYASAFYQKNKVFVNQSTLEKADLVDILQQPANALFNFQQIQKTTGFSYARSVEQKPDDASITDELKSRFRYLFSCKKPIKANKKDSSTTKRNVAFDKIYKILKIAEDEDTIPCMTVLHRLC